MRILIKRAITVTQNEAVSPEYESIPLYEAGAVYNAGEKVICAVMTGGAQGVATPASGAAGAMPAQAFADPSIDIPEIDYIFEAGADNTTTSPADDALSWINHGATEKYLAFDKYSNTVSRLEPGDMIEVRATRATALFLGNFSGSATLEIFVEKPLNELELIETYHIEKKRYLYEPAMSWTTYFFRVFIATIGAQDTFVEFPGQFGAVRARLTAGAYGFSVGRIAMGSFTMIGQTKAAPNIGLLDFSIKETDAKGESYLKQGRFAKLASFDVIVPTPRLDAVYGALNEVRAKPTLFAADELNRFNALMVYGFFRDFNVVLSGTEFSECSLEIEGLT